MMLIYALKLRKQPELGLYRRNSDWRGKKKAPRSHNMTNKLHNWIWNAQKWRLAKKENQKVSEFIFIWATYLEICARNVACNCIFIKYVTLAVFHFFPSFTIFLFIFKHFSLSRIRNMWKLCAAFPYEEQWLGITINVNYIFLTRSNTWRTH